MSISLEERDRRYRGLGELMHERELDSLLVAGRGDHVSRGNIRYITDFGIITGQVYCIFPQNAGPVLITLKTPYLSKLREAGWISVFSVTSNPLKQVIEELAHFDRGNKVGIVGMADISVPMYLAVQARFPDRVVDTTDIFKQMRLAKSPEEIEKIRKSASIADRVFIEMKKMIRPGLSDYKIYGEIKRIIHEMGCQYSMELISAEETKTNIFFPTGDILRSQGTLNLEITPSYEGYYSQLVVTLPVKEYPPHIKKMIPIMENVLRTSENILHPGTKVSDVNQVILKMIHENGYLPLGERSGHGIGLDVIDFWAIAESETLELKPGMTFVLHPGILAETDGGGITIGYTYLITDTGIEKLNKVDIMA
jgi:Xaa-Pro dipeptidase